MSEQSGNIPGATHIPFPWYDLPGGLPSLPGIPALPVGSVFYMALQRCPVCEGKGCVPWDPAWPFGTPPTTQTSWRCPTCRGARVLDGFGQPAAGHLPPPEGVTAAGKAGP